MILRELQRRQAVATIQCCTLPKRRVYVILTVTTFRPETSDYRRIDLGTSGLRDQNFALDETMVL